MKGTCSTCKHWKGLRDYDHGPGLGNAACHVLLMVLDVHDDEGIYMYPDTVEAPWDFGCNKWEAKPPDEKTT